VPVLLLAPPLPPLIVTITPETPLTPGILGTGKNVCEKALLSHPDKNMINIVNIK
jgi:hypothetical protein